MTTTVPINDERRAKALIRMAYVRAERQAYRLRVSAVTTHHRILYYKAQNGKPICVAMSPPLITIGEVAAEIHRMRTTQPTDGHYQVIRIDHAPRKIKVISNCIPANYD